MNATIVPPVERPVIKVMGHDQRIQLSGRETGGMFTLIDQTSAPGLGVPPHVHEREDETFCVIEGEVEFTAEGRTQVVGAGGTVYLPRGVPHTFTAVGDAPARMIIVLAPSGAEDMFAELAALGEGPPEMEKVTEICGRYGISFL